MYSLTWEVNQMSDIEAALIAQHKHDNSSTLTKACQLSNWKDWEDTVQGKSWYLNTIKL